MKSQSIWILPGVLASALISAVAQADGSHHTIRLDWLDVDSTDDHPALRAGHVIDVHTEGPPVASLQSFFVNGARPGTSYEVVYLLDGFDADLCARIDTFPFHPGAYLETNARGMGTASMRFSQDGLGLIGVIFGVRFQLLEMDSGAIAYETPCMVTTNDP